MSDVKPVPMEVTLTVRAVACVYPGREANTMHWKIADCTVLVSKDDGTEIGRVSGCIGGGMEISDKRHEAGSVTYFIRADEFWNAYEHAIEKGAVPSEPAPPRTPFHGCEVCDGDDHCTCPGRSCLCSVCRPAPPTKTEEKWCSVIVRKPSDIVPSGTAELECGNPLPCPAHPAAETKK